MVLYPVIKIINKINLFYPHPLDNSLILCYNYIIFSMPLARATISQGPQTMDKVAKSLKFQANGPWTAETRKRYQRWRYQNDPEYRANHIKTATDHKRKQACGITPEEYDKKLIEAQGRCEICDLQCTGLHGLSAICLDHDHASGKVRGMLCGRCNTALGKFLDSPDILEKAIAYLKKYA